MNQGEVYTIAVNFQILDVVPASSLGMPRYVTPSIQRDFLQTVLKSELVPGTRTRHSFANLNKSSVLHITNTRDKKGDYLNLFLAKRDNLHFFSFIF